MLSVLGKAFKRRKSASQLSTPEDCAVAAPEDQPRTETIGESSLKRATGSTISAEILESRDRQIIASPSNASNFESNLVSDVVFIDGRISQISRLLRELDPQAEIHVLDQQTDGVDQIVTHLAGQDGLQALHLFCHGDSGTLVLGSGRVTVNTITTTHSNAFSRIGSALSESGEILIYGCDFCSGPNGNAAAAQLAMLTGAEVAASPEIFDDNEEDNEEDNEIERDGVENLANISPTPDLIPDEEVPAKSEIPELSYSAPDGGRLEISAEEGLLHLAGLAGGTLKSATDGSGSSIKINEPGGSELRSHILPNGAELTQFSNGSFTYQSETDAGEGELFTCLAVGSDLCLAKFTVSLKVDSPDEFESDPATQSEGEPPMKSADDAKLPLITAQVSNTNSHQLSEQSAKKNAAVDETELSIHVPDTSAGPIAETTTMVDAPLIFLQRNMNAISVSGLDNKIIVLTVAAKNGTLCARPLKGAQVEGFNSVNLSVAGTAKQINGALDGLRFVNFSNHSGPAELAISAHYEKSREHIMVSKTVSIYVKSLAFDGNFEAANTGETLKPAVKIEPPVVAPEVFLDEQSSTDESSRIKSSNTQTVDQDKAFVSEFIAPVGAVTTIAIAGETMKLTDGDLQINSDGTFSFSLKEGYTKSSSRVTCRVDGQGADPIYPPEIMLNLSRLPLRPGKTYAGNVFSSDTHAFKLSTDEYEASKVRSLGEQSDLAEEISLDNVEDDATQIKSEPIELLGIQTSAEFEEEVPFSRILENEAPIASSAPIVLAEQFDERGGEELPSHSLNFSFDRKGRQTDITSRMRPGQITLNTYKQHQTLFLDVNNTFDPQEHGIVNSCHIELIDGSPFPEWMREIRGGFYSFNLTNPSEMIELKVSTKIQGGSERCCFVTVDGDDGTIEPLQSHETPDGFYQRVQSTPDFSSGFASV